MAGGATAGHRAHPGAWRATGELDYEAIRRAASAEIFVTSRVKSACALAIAESELTSVPSAARSWKSAKDWMLCS